MLYELLTGEIPFRGSIQMLIQQVINEPAPEPLSLDSSLHRDIAAITMKCLEKMPTKRYQTASELWNELQRFLNGQPTLTRPLSRHQKMWRWCKRNRRLSAAVGLALSSLLLLAVGGPVLAYNAELSKRAAEQNANRAQAILDIVTNAFQSTNPEEGGSSTIPARQILVNAQAAMTDSRLDYQGRTQLTHTLASAFFGIGAYELSRKE